MKTRITLDIDSKSKFKVAYILFKSMNLIKDIGKVEVLKSQNGNHHMIIWSKKYRKLSEQYKLREKLGDDPRRIKLDKKKKLGRNTLFATKKERVKKWKGRKKIT